MPPPNELFRATALEELNSPEQLDQLLRVTKPSSWIALLAITVIVVSAGVWSFIGTIATKVHGRGILIDPNGVSEIQSTARGRLESLKKSVGDRVQEGEVIAVLVIPELQDQVEDASKTYREAQRKLELFAKTREENAQMRRRTLDGKIKALQSQQARTSERIQVLEKRLRDRQYLLAEGLITELQVSATQEDLSQAKGTLESLTNQKNDLELDFAQSGNLDRQAELEDQQRVEDAHRVWQTLNSEYEEKRKIICHRAGRVVEILVEEGKEVQQDESILVVESESSSMRALVYVSSWTGKRIEEGMKIYIEPSIAKKEQFGLMIGRVDSVSELPSTRAGMLSATHNAELVDEFLKEGAPISVSARLLPDEHTVSRYRWTSGPGAPIKISNGTLCQAEVTVYERAPIELIIPFIKSKLGY